MTDAISPSGPAHHISPSQSPQERHRMFEIQFETSVLGIFVAVTGQNGSMQHQVSQLKNGIKAGNPPAELASGLNQLVSQINTSIAPGKAPFPTFLFSSEGSQAQALTHHAITLEKCLNTLAEHGHLPWPQEHQLFSQLAGLVNTIPQIPAAQAYSELNHVIDQANAHLIRRYQIPSLPSS